MPGWVSSSLPKTSLASLTLNAPLAACTRGRAIDLRNVLVWLVDVLDRQDGQVAVITVVAQGKPGTGLDAEPLDLGLVDVERDGHAEEGAIGQTVVLDDSMRLLAIAHALFASQRAERTHCSPSPS